MAGLDALSIASSWVTLREANESIPFPCDNAPSAAKDRIDVRHMQRRAMGREGVKIEAGFLGN